MGAVLIEGPKWCGKTTTAEQQAQSIIFMDSPRQRESYIEVPNIDPNLLLEGATPRFIDEWQVAPKLWDAVRFTVDHRGEDTQFILTGSAVPMIDEEENAYRYRKNWQNKDAHHESLGIRGFIRQNQSEIII